MFKMSQEAPKKESFSARWHKIAGVVVLYWFISISMVFINKYLLSSEDLKLDAPFFITLSQCVVAVVCFVVMGAYSFYFPKSIDFPPVEINPETALKVMPLSLVFVGMIVFNNLTLKYLGIAFYNVGRSLTTVFNVALTYLVLKLNTSGQALVCCGVIVGGFLLGLKEEDKSLAGSISVFGVFSGIAASLCVALYAIYTKKTLGVVGDNIWRLQYYNNLNAVVMLGALTFLTERTSLSRFKFWFSPQFWCLIFLAGMFGIAIGYVTSLQIKVTSPLTHNVSGTAKACAQTILACVVFSERKGVWWWLSNVMVLGGSSAYTYVRMQEMKKDHEEASEKNHVNLMVIDENECEGNE